MHRKTDSQHNCFSNKLHIGEISRAGSSLGCRMDRNLKCKWSAEHSASGKNDNKIRKDGNKTVRGHSHKSQPCRQWFLQCNSDMKPLFVLFVFLLVDHSFLVRKWRFVHLESFRFRSSHWPSRSFSQGVCSRRSLGRSSWSTRPRDTTHTSLCQRLNKSFQITPQTSDRSLNALNRAQMNNSVKILFFCTTMFAVDWRIPP